jgi:uncharacterized membrane protein YgdD (TMEM256/DUF423 family)
MIARFFGFVERSLPLAAGILFAVVGVVAAIHLPSSANQMIGGYMTYLVFHTAAMLIVGLYMNRAKNFLALSWFAALLLFFVVAFFFRT